MNLLIKKNTENERFSIALIPPKHYLQLEIEEQLC